MAQSSRTSSLARDSRGQDFPSDDLRHDRLRDLRDLALIRLDVLMTNHSD